MQRHYVTKTRRDHRYVCPVCNDMEESEYYDGNVMGESKAVGPGKNSHTDII